MELAIDTSTDWAGLALSTKGLVVSEHTWKAGQNHTTELLPRLRSMLDQAHAEISSLTAIFVARGPGSYNGLRAGVSAAKGLAFSLGLPVVGVSTLEVEAYAFAFTGLPVCALQDAGRGEIGAAFYKYGARWKAVKEEHLTTVGSLCAGVKTRTVFCGEISSAAEEAIASTLGKKAVIPPFNDRLRRPGCLVALGWQRLEAGHCDDPATLQPIYLRQPPITLRKKKY